MPAFTGSTSVFRISKLTGLLSDHEHRAGERDGYAETTAHAASRLSPRCRDHPARKKLAEEAFKIVNNLAVSKSRAE
jgi:hypothetical protein